MVVDRNLARRAAVHAALADPARLAVVDELCLADRAPSELGASLGMASNLLAHHLRVLEGVGLVERVVSEGDRRRRYLRLRPEVAAPFAARTPLVARSIVFVCTANSARSPLAAALWNQRHLPSATSAGTHPGTALHPRAVAAARALGLELGATRPRALGPLDPQADLVITVCDRAHEALGPSAAPYGRALHWSVPDPVPAGSKAAFAAAAGQLADRILRVAPAIVAAAA